MTCEFTVRRTITALRRAKLEPEGVESICLDVKGCDNSWFLIYTSYRSSSKCKISKFLSSCASTAGKMYSKRKEVIFLGDFNIDMLSETGPSVGSSYNLSNFCDRFCLTNTIPSPTRVIPTVYYLSCFKIATHVITSPLTKLFKYCIGVGEWPYQ